MAESGVPISFQKSDQSLAWENFTPISCPSPQLFSPVLSILWNNQSSCPYDQLSLPTSAVRPPVTQPTARTRTTRVFWTEEEHRNFLSGIASYGRGKWKIIARHAVKTKTPSQVASHAQKHFIRQSVAPDKRKRSSIHDTTIADVISVPRIEPQQLPVASLWHPTPISLPEPQQSVAPTVQPAAPMESQAVPWTLSAPVHMGESMNPSTLFPCMPCMDVHDDFDWIQYLKLD